MKENEVKLTWDGEKIKQEVIVPDLNITPKQMLDSLDQAKNKAGQMQQQKTQLETNLKLLKESILSAENFVKEREVFEKECIEIQLEKLDHYIRQVYNDCKEQAANQAKETISQSPAAYTEDQKSNMAYVNFQRLLATNGKIAQNISNKIITQHIFVEPRFTNPFKVD